MAPKSPSSIPAGVIIAILFSTLFIGLLDNQILSPMLVEISTSLHCQVTRVAGTVTAYAVMAGLTGLLIMPLADRGGRARFLKGAMVVVIIASLTATLAKHWLAFYVARVLAGLAGGIISAGVISYAADLFPYSQRGRVMGIISTSYFAAPILGIPLSAQLVSWFGWRFVYGSLAALAGVLLGLMPHYLPELLRPPTILRETPYQNYKGILNDRPRRLGVFSAFFISAGTGGFMTYLGPWLATQFGLTVREVAYVYLMAGLAALVGALLSGALADRFGKKRVILLGNVLYIIILSRLYRLAYGPSLVLALGLAGLVAAFRYGPLQALLTQLVAANQRSAYIGIRNTVSQLGIAASVLVAGFLYQDAAGFANIVIFSAGMIALASVIIWRIAEPREEIINPADAPAFGNASGSTVGAPANTKE
ncbi:MAG: MFS transporter [Acidobacteria bacterium]|nr:MFS transporter [Acidobacteriota bacterium]MBI3655621.1 MFS transporter [Acidobacteriota bacterium]